ncbi:extracellular calcium-sensing receptor-like protein [Labeo rohita]|uniref:Extracellular calcium-sensing receptor-like protein n=1 Tax=Labeo rohita TaxID=84645 RepID=A0A498MCV8_LABRO|nr:extracellular calcium-sensing receptor-like protein [Labeo rohita]
MAQTMIFAIDEINNSKSLLPNISIGYRIYDTCGSRLSSMSATMALMNGQEFAAEDTCDGQSPIHAIIGETESSATVILSRTTGPFKIPVISHSATCECLSNRKNYPSFFRTIASDYHQSRALAYIIKHFGWSWVGAVNSDNDYGNNGMGIFLNTAQEEGICVEYSEKFYRTEPEKLRKVVATIKKSTAKVVEALKRVNFTVTMGDRVWFDSTGAAVAQYEVVNWQKDSDGSIQFTPVGYYDASLPPDQRFVLKTENIIWTGGQLEVVEALKKVNFTVKMGDRVWFDSTGATVAQYEVVNWQRDSNGSIQFKAVGYYDASLPLDQRFVLNTKNIIWAGGQIEKPRSVCSESCPPGTRKAAQKGRPVCCYDCVPCAEGEISNETVQDYFTKWVEAYPLPNDQAVTVAEVIVAEWVCRYGAPLSLHSDQGTNFESEVFQTMCELLDIDKTRTTPFRPQRKTIASDYHQSRALAYIVKHFGWSWVGAVNSDNDYGNNGMTIFLNTAQEEGICVEYSVKFYRTEPDKLQKVVETIKKSTAKVVEALKNVNFTVKMGDRVWFDSTGGVVAQYEVVNWQKDSDGSVQFKPVGYYDASLPPDQRFVLNTENIIWVGGQLEKPRSVCSESCPPGTRKATQKGRPVCCYDCIPCAEGEISNETDSNNCKQCPGEYWSNAEKNKCVLKAVEFLSFTEVMGIVLIFFSLFGVGLTALVAILFYNFVTNFGLTVFIEAAVVNAMLLLGTL